MNKWKRYTLRGLGLIGIILVSLIIWISQATSTRHETITSTLGQKSDLQALVSSFDSDERVANSSRVVLKTIKSANWVAPLSGLVNLNHPKAKAVALEDHDEKIQIYAYHLQHPKYGDFLVDTGVSKQFVEEPKSFGVPAWLEPELGFNKMDVLTSTGEFIAGLNRPLKGVFLSHLHLDHISGLPAIAKDVPLYIGKNESKEKYFLFAATRGIVDTLLNGRPALQEWTSQYVDVFNDGSVFAIHSPGHTAGSTAYLVNTVEGPVLLVGDASHTAWGWNNQVEPGEFSTDQKESQRSLSTLIELVKKHPSIKVKLGHQDL